MGYEGDMVPLITDKEVIIRCALRLSGIHLFLLYGVCMILDKQVLFLNEQN